MRVALKPAASESTPADLSAAGALVDGNYKIKGSRAFRLASHAKIREVHDHKAPAIPVGVSYDLVRRNRTRTSPDTRSPSSLLKRIRLPARAIRLSSSDQSSRGR